MLQADTKLLKEKKKPVLKLSNTYFDREEDECATNNCRTASSYNNFNIEDYRWVLPKGSSDASSGYHDKFVEAQETISNRLDLELAHRFV